MRIFGAGRKDYKKKRRRFRRPDFQQKLERARKFVRKPKERPQNISGKVFFRLGLRSRLGRFFAGAALAAAVYYLAISSFFLVSVAVVDGQNLKEEQIAGFLERVQSERKFLIPENHIFFLTEEKFAKRLKREFPDVRNVTRYTRILPNRIEISVEVREQKYVWNSGERYYFMDQGGVIFGQISEYDPAAYPQILVRDSLSQPVAVGEDLGVDKVVAFLGGMERAWGEIVSGINYTSASLPSKASIDLFVQTDAGFEVYFDLNRGARGQFQNLQFLLTQEINPETWSGLSYIDLRLADIAYYCYKDAPCAGQPAQN